MVNDKTKQIVEKLKELHSKNGGRTFDFVEIEQSFYKVASVEDLRYFYRTCRDSKGALFHQQQCLKYLLLKTNMFSKVMFEDATLDQKIEMLNKALKVGNSKYLINMFNLCPKELKKQEVRLAKDLARTKYLKLPILSI